MDLSKAYDCLSHVLLLAKMEVYGYTYNSLRLINAFLDDRRQRVKVESSSSSWQKHLVYHKDQY